jgi:GNAT superfamily N-acetyltransferase
MITPTSGFIAGHSTPVGLEVAASPLDAPEAAALREASVLELGERYGYDGAGPPLRPVEYEPPLGAFLVAWLDGRAVGCGGLTRLEDETAEIRRMYVAPAGRRRGVGRAVLAALERRGRELGYARIRLETGDAQPEAVALYESARYRRVPCWALYRDDPRSICFEKELAG